ncbi:MAG: hypothetical protein WCC10_18080 [Tumebacillaceae bacterium]
MAETFDALGAVKQVLVKHMLRQQVETDLALIRRADLHLSRTYIDWLERIHARLLTEIAEHKRALRRHRVRIINQQKNSLDFQIAYLERGYQVQHCFLLATLQAEAHLLFATYVEGGSR